MLRQDEINLELRELEKQEDVYSQKIKKIQEKRYFLLSEMASLIMMKKPIVNER